MNITYKYKIGQKVTLTNCAINFGLCNNSTKLLGHLLNKEVTIVNRGFILYEAKYANAWESIGNLVNGMYIQPFYYIEEDPNIINRNNNWGYTRTRIDERSLTGEIFNETIDEKFVTDDDINIIPGETVIYEDILRKYESGDVANCRFTFSSEGLVIGIRKNYEIYPEHPEDEYEIYTFRQFLCDFEPDETHPNPRPRLDDARYGHKHWVCLYCDQRPIYVKAPENYAELFVKTAINDKFFGFNVDPFEDKDEKWEVEQWLKHLGVYDEAKKLYKEQVPEKIKKVMEAKKHQDEIACKISEYLKSLSEEEKAELRKQLK